MRKITPDSFAVYTLDELEPDAREKAISEVAEKLGGDWWGQHDIFDISETITYALATALGTPGREQWGEADFPGIPSVALEGWDLDRDTLDLRGALDRDNAPGLPWADGVTDVVLKPARWDGTEIDVRWDEDERDPDQERDLTVVREECTALALAVEEAVEAAIQQAKSAGRAEMEYKTSLEYAEEDIEANEREFLADGSLYV